MTVYAPDLTDLVGVYVLAQDLAPLVGQRTIRLAVPTGRWPGLNRAFGLDVVHCDIAAPAVLVTLECGR